MDSTVTGASVNAKEHEVSSTCEQKFQTEKKTKKKYQKFSPSPKKNAITIKTENTDNVIKYKNVEKSSSDFINNKDFPALTILKKFPPENSNHELKNKQWAPPLSYGDIKISGECFPTLPGNGTLMVNKQWAPPLSYGDIKISDECFPTLHGNGTLRVNKQWAPPLSYGGIKISDECFPTLPGNGYIKKDVGNSKMKENQLMPTTGKNISDANKGKKPNSTKKASAQVPVQKNPNKKKRADPVFINFQDILKANQRRRRTRQHNIVKSGAQRIKEKEHLSGNILDSSNPKRNKGKHREIKKEKLSNLKLNIIKERIIKNKMKEKHTEDPHLTNDCFNLINTIDFKTEIKLYLNELNEKKMKLNENKNLKKNKKQMEDNADKKSKEDTEKVNSVNKENKISFAVPKEIKFSSNFREYCDNIITPELNSAVKAFIKELIELQDRLFLKDPLKAKIKKRHVFGFREVKKYLNLKKVKFVIIAPNLEKLQMDGSIFDLVNQIKATAASQNVPYGFALDRYRLGRLTKKSVSVSVFAVLNYEGIESLYEKTLSELMEAKKKFLELKETKKEEETNDLNSQIISSLISAFRDEFKINGQESETNDDESCLD